MIIEIMYVNVENILASKSKNRECKQSEKKSQMHKMPKKKKCLVT